MAMKKLLLSVGSYEKSLYGVEITVQDDIQVTSKVAFAFPAHTGYLKCISSTNTFLATGSTDESTRLFHLLKRKDYGTLTLHSGSVTALQLFEQAGVHFLASGSEDGMVAIYTKQSRDWECVQKLRAHKRGVTAIAVHPTGKLLMSAGNDRKLKLWDLVRGNLSYAEPSKFVIEGIKWSSTAAHYVLYGERNLSIYEAKEAKCILKITEPPFKVLTATFFDEEHLLVGGEGSNIAIISLKSLETELKDIKQKPRIRCISVFEGYVFTASSDGVVLMWNGLNFTAPMHNIKTGLRITCQTVSMNIKK